MNALVRLLDRAEARMLAHRRLAWLALVVGVAVVGVQAVAVKDQGDFSLSYEAANDLWAGAPVYDAEEASPYLYSPLYAVLLSPLAWTGSVLGYNVAKALFTALSFSCLAGVLILLRRTLAGSPPERVPGWVIAVPLVLSSRLLLNNFQHGQANVIVLVFLLGSWELMRRGRQAAAAFCILPAVAIKFVLPLVFVGYFAVRRRLRFIATLTVLAVLGFLLPALVVGLDRNLALHAQWLGLLPVVASRPEHLESWNNQSAMAVALRLFRETREGAPRVALLEPWVPQAIFGTMTLGMGAASGLAILFHRGRNGEPANLTALAEFCLLALFMATASPLAWKHYFSIWFVPLALLCFAVARGHRHAPLYVGTLALVALAVSLPGGSLVRPLARELLNWGSVFWCNAVIWLCVLDWLWTRPTREPVRIRSDSRPDPRPGSGSRG
jgi:hypothetical protein